MTQINTEELKHRFGGHWGEDPDNPVSAWQECVAENCTRLSYWEWLYCVIETVEERIER